MFVKDLDTVQGKCFSSETGSERRRLKEDEVIREKGLCISPEDGEIEEMEERAAHKSLIDVLGLRFQIGYLKLPSLA